MDHGYLDHGNKSHKIKPQKRETIATGSVTLPIMEMGKIERGTHLEKENLKGSFGHFKLKIPTHG